MKRRAAPLGIAFTPYSAHVKGQVIVLRAATLEVCADGEHGGSERTLATKQQRDN